ncbi:glycosyltransferase family 4 protein [Candidatus Acetothermia bacterium]|jgi:1,2-diacylglycerol-3-alpha-glucose alpha-1,2-glucosyltransferase|nr:glycosyltransferase family 4 protein [Candidatus Acetothermia bacterium]MCI2431551.1 glycosyltransferase family 4 protein [Candidatus Acetothermia bacterium]MCI2437156.1 glycosyltransferase family 4 protein [Candidatus Acetothermia bacterium]
MRVCLYLEAAEMVAKSGFRTAFEQQRRALRSAGIEVTDDPARDDYDLLHLHFFGPKSLFYLKRAQHLGVKVIAHAHSIGAHDFEDSFTLVNSISGLYEKYLYYFYESSDAVMTCSQYACEQLRAQGISKPIFVISNAVDRQRFKFNPEKRQHYRELLQLQRFTVFSAGNVIPRKGILDFLEVARRLPELDFVWFGHLWPKFMTFYPDMHNALEAKPPNVKMPGFVSDTPAAFSAGDLCFLPSFRENQPMVLLEALSLGRPLVVREIPEYHGWLEDGVNARLGSSVEEFISQIRQLAETPREWQRLSWAAEELAKASSLPVVGRRLKELYTLVLEEVAPAHQSV